VNFRDDILRGVRLFLIIFAGVLTCVAAYRMMHSTGEAAVQEAPPPDAQPVPETASSADPSTETHGLVVPEPPPVPGEKPKVKAPPPVKHVAKFDTSVPPPPQPAVSHAKRVAAVPSGRGFETSEPVALPAPLEEPSNPAPSTPKSGVGYKSLMEVDTNRAAVESAPHPLMVQVPDQPEEEKPKGNRFFRAVGKIFHPSGKKETAPQTLQPQKQ
jgi:hypothetical protein